MASSRADTVHIIIKDQVKRKVFPFPALEAADEMNNPFANSVARPFGFFETERIRALKCDKDPGLREYMQYKRLAASDAATVDAATVQNISEQDLTKINKKSNAAALEKTAEYERKDLYDNNIADRQVNPYLKFEFQNTSCKVELELMRDSISSYLETSKISITKKINQDSIKNLFEECRLKNYMRPHDENNVAVSDLTKLFWDIMIQWANVLWPFDLSQLVQGTINEFRFVQIIGLWMQSKQFTDFHLQYSCNIRTSHLRKMFRIYTNSVSSEGIGVSENTLPSMYPFQFVQCIGLLLMPNLEPTRKFNSTLTEHNLDLGRDLDFIYNLQKENPEGTFLLFEVRIERNVTTGKYVACRITGLLKTVEIPKTPETPVYEEYNVYDEYNAHSELYGGARNRGVVNITGIGEEQDKLNNLIDQLIIKLSFCNKSIKETIINIGENEYFQINIDCCTFTNKQMEGLFKNLNAVRSLSIENTEIADFGIKILAESLKQNKSLKTLSLKHVYFTNACGKLLAEALEVNSSLEELAISADEQNKLYKEAILSHRADVLANRMKEMRHAEFLALRKLATPIFTDEGFKFLAEALEKNNSLKKLKLNCPWVSGTSAHYLAKCLLNNKTMTDLEVALNPLNPLGDIGAKDLSIALKSNYSLRIWNLRYSYIGDLGARYLAEMLKANSCLQALTLDGNEFGEAAALYLADALKINNSLKSLSLSLCCFNGADSMFAKGKRYLPPNTAASAVFHLAEALKENTSLEHFGFSLNNLGFIGARYIAETLKINKTLKQLFLFECKLGNDGIKCIVDVLKEKTSLQMVSLTGNDLDESGLDYLVDALKTKEFPRFTGQNPSNPKYYFARDLEKNWSLRREYLKVEVRQKLEEKYAESSKRDSIVEVFRSEERPKESQKEQPKKQQKEQTKEQPKEQPNELQKEKPKELPKEQQKVQPKEQQKVQPKKEQTLKNHKRPDKRVRV